MFRVPSVRLFFCCFFFFFLFYVALLANRVCYMIEEDEGCFLEATRRFRTFVGELKEKNHQLGRINTREALKLIAPVTMKESTITATPIGSDNLPCPMKSLDEFCSEHGVDVSNSSLEGKGCFTSKTRKKGETILYYFGKLHAECTRVIFTTVRI